VAIFSDNFDRASASDLGAGWVEVSGDWSIVSNQLSPGSVGGTIILRAAGAMDSSDHYAQVTIAATTPVSQGVWCRGNSDLTSGYAWRNNGSNWSLFSVLAGAFTSIGTYTAAAVAGDVAKVQAVGSTIKGFVNGVERVSVVNTAVTTGTSVGIRSEANTGLRFDNFAAADVTADAALGAATEADSAQQLTGGKTATLSLASASEAAQPVTGAKAATLGTAAASEAAQQLAGAKTAILGTATETASTQALAGAKTATLTPVDEQNTAQALNGVKTGVLGVAESVEEVQPITGTVTATLSAAGSVETALPLVGVKTAVLVPALEADTARPLTVSSTTVPSPERTYRIPAESRRLVVAAENRTLIVRR
jgi:hypothetical protein